MSQFEVVTSSVTASSPSFHPSSFNTLSPPVGNLYQFSKRMWRTGEVLLCCRFVTTNISCLSVIAEALDSWILCHSFFHIGPHRLPSGHFRSYQGNFFLQKTAGSNKQVFPAWQKKMLCFPRKVHKRFCFCSEFSRSNK